MKFFSIITCMFLGVTTTAHADKLCMLPQDISGALWNTDFAAATAGWNGGATDAAISGMGTIATTADPTWRAKITVGGVDTVVSGTHRCSAVPYDNSAHGRYDADGKFCYCRVTLVNEAGNAGVLSASASDYPDSAACASGCPAACADRMKNSDRYHMLSYLHLEENVASCPYGASSMYDFLNLPIAVGTVSSMGGAGGSNAIGELGLGGTWAWHNNIDNVAGIHWCAGNGGMAGVDGTPSGQNGQHCWCKMVAIGADGTCKGRWIYGKDHGAAANCSTGGDTCAKYCAATLQGNLSFRSAVLILE